MHIYLIGMPGAGKSTVGKMLAQKLQLPFIDLDAAIEETAGQTIPGIFAAHGETYFRNLESQVLKAVSFSAEKLLVATGGGTPCFLDNLDLMLAHGQAVYLKASPQKLTERLKNSPLSTRPLLKDKTELQLLAYVNQTLTARSPFYQKAGIIIETGSVTETVAAALKALNPV